MSFEEPVSETRCFYRFATRCFPVCGCTVACWSKEASGALPPPAALILVKFCGWTDFKRIVRPPKAFKVRLCFLFTGAWLYLLLDLARLVKHCAELRYPDRDDVSLDSSDLRFIEMSDLTTVEIAKGTQLHYEGLDLCRLIVKIDFGLASSSVFPSIKFQFWTDTILSIFLG